MNRTKHRLSEREKKDSSKNSFKQQQQRRPPPQRQQLDTCAADSLAERDISKAASATDDATPDARSIEVSVRQISPVKAFPLNSVGNGSCLRLVSVVRVVCAKRGLAAADTRHLEVDLWPSRYIRLLPNEPL